MTGFAGQRRDRPTEIKRAVRLAVLAIMLRDGHVLTSRKVADHFGICMRAARQDLEDVGDIIPVTVEPGRNPGTLPDGRCPGRTPNVWRALAKEEVRHTHVIPGGQG